MEFILTILIGLLVMISMLLGGTTRLWARSGLMVGVCLIFYGILSQPWVHVEPWRYFPRIVNLREASESAFSLVENTTVQDILALLEKIRGLTALNSILVVGGLGSLLGEFSVLALIFLGIGGSIFTAIAGILLQSTQMRLAGTKLWCLALLSGNTVAILCYVLSLPQVDALGGIGRPELAIALTLVGVGYGNGLIFIGIGMAVISASFAFYVLGRSPVTPSPREEQEVKTLAKRYFTTTKLPIQNKPKVVNPSPFNSRRRSSLLLTLPVLAICALLFLPILMGSSNICDQRYARLNDLLQNAHASNPLLVEAALRLWNISWVQGQIHAADLFWGSTWRDIAIQICEGTPTLNGLWLMQHGGEAWTMLLVGVVALLGFEGLMSIAPHAERHNLVYGLAVYQVLLTMVFTIAAMTLDSFGFQNEFGPRLLSVLGDLQLGWGFIVVLVLVLALLPVSLVMIGKFGEQ